MANKVTTAVPKLSLFDRPPVSARSRDESFLHGFLTFRNIVVGLGVLALLAGVWSAGGFQMALLVASLLVLLGLMLFEMSSRRRWERDMISQMQRASTDYDRLVRDVARNRNDTALLRKRLSDAAASVARSYDARITSEPAEQRMLRSLVDQLSKLSDLPEANDDVAVIPETEPDLTAAPLPASPEHLTEAQILQLVRNAAKQDSIDLFLQPVVGLPQRKLRFYEMFSRIRLKPGAYLPAADYIEAAHKQDLVPIIDNLLLLRGLQMIRNTDDGSYNRAFFFNITSPTLSDPKFMGDLVEFISQNRALAPRLIFELGQDDLSTISADIVPVLDGLSKLGCRFSMDRVKSLNLNFARLESLHIRFLKADAALLMNEMKDDAGLTRLKRFKNELDRNGIDLIVEKIETDKQLLEMLEIEIDYGQGFLFGKPALYEKS